MPGPSIGGWINVTNRNGDYVHRVQVSQIVSYRDDGYTTDAGEFKIGGTIVSSGSGSIFVYETAADIDSLIAGA